MPLIFAVLMLSGCASGISVGTYWQFGDASRNLGTLSITNHSGFSSYVYVGYSTYGPIRHGETIVLQLRSGTYYVRDNFGNSRYVTIRSYEKILLILS